ncbi:MAG TPA: cysteine--tRNA ligase [Chloroflexota bacterium]|nr:cysteine--tRNA ligase [Chloroflexota bacterium]
MPRDDIQLTNTLSGRLEEFRPLTDHRVLIYTCGPTVYRYAHIGNFRALIFADTLRRMFEYNGYEVRHVRNITDVGHLTNDTLGEGIDRIEAQARAENMSPWDIAAHYTDAFLQDARRLNLLEPTASPRATEYIAEMTELIQRLIDEGHAYESNGNVYFDVSSYPSYGKLSHNSVDDLIAGARVEVGEDKRSPADFALWKAAGPEKLMRWESPWGEGVPGWHIECSAMSMDLLGDQIDIHTGGQDNIFPHHEDERAQSEAATGEEFVRYWMHNAFLELANNEKMSKSRGNIFTIEDLIERGIHPLTYRYFTFQAHYRTPLTFSWEALEAAQTALVRIWEAAAELSQSAGPEEPGKVAQTYRDRFRTAISRDLDMPTALAVLHEVLGSQLPAGQKLSLVRDFDSVLGLSIAEMAACLSETTTGQNRLLDERAAARSQRDWQLSDRLRDELAASGLEVRDTPQGQRWVRKDLLPRYQAQEPPEQDS